jgi:hypothetical protein
VDKNRFISLLHHYSDSTTQDAEDIISLKSQYPYSQLLHVLSARVTQDHHFENAPQELQLAAIHAADRTVLKEIISFLPSQESTSISNKEEPVLHEVKRQHILSIDSIDVADEVIRDLKQLTILKNNFEMLLVEYSEIQAEPKAVAKALLPPPEAELKHPPVKKQGQKERTKSRKERIIELAKAINSPEITVDHTSGEDTIHQTTSKQRADELIEQIRNTKEEIVPESDKQKEQIEIINQFIKTQPSISSSKDRIIATASDLNPIKSGEFGDNIVSETLVEILIKQGKRDKAIEVLKKLIWKYPQKKSYFASQIEDLKK